MNFNTFLFYPFLAAVVIVNFLLPRRFRWAWLLIASFVFYGLLDARFLAVLLACTAIAYTGGRVIDRSAEEKRKKAWTAGAVGLLVGILFLFKYLGFFFDILNSAASAAGLRFHLRGIAWFYPAGISFYALQAVSYLLDVFNGRVRAEKNPGVFALYLSFFPQLLIGPIERFEPFGIQIREPAPFEYQRFVNGLLRIGWGLFKKVVIADRLALYVDEVYANSGDYAGAPMWIATYFFAIQVYCDFAGYSDIAIGSARCMGYKLVTNFKRPYLADSFKSFWERWHISLTMWFRDYVYFALGGSRKGRLRTYFNILALFTLCGLWHGARWNCVLWGTANGVYLVMGQLTRDAQDRWARLVGLHKVPLVRKVLAILFTFTLFVVSLMIWRSETIPNAITNIGLAFSSGANSLSVTAPMAGYELSLAVIALALLLALEIAQERKDSELLEEFNAKPRWIRWPVYYAGLYSVLIFGVFDLREFVYFQF